MDKMIKKRIKALLIDSLVSSAVSLTAEAVLRKSLNKEKSPSSEFVYTTVMPIAAFWGMEYLQLRKNGQTIGQKMQGIIIEDAAGGEVTPEQFVKRVMHRDSISPLVYYKNREAFDGARLPHDIYAGTVVKEQ